jgi:hypothetical protein
MTETTKLGWEDICRHEHRCEGKQFFFHTVPDYHTYCQATHWLRVERGYKFICAAAEISEKEYPERGGKIHTGRFIFKFLCEQEYMWFKLRWE